MLRRAQKSMMWQATQLFLSAAMCWRRRTKPFQLLQLWPTDTVAYYLRKRQEERETRILESATLTKPTETSVFKGLYIALKGRKKVAKKVQRIILDRFHIESIKNPPICVIFGRFWQEDTPCRHYCRTDLVSRYCATKWSQSKFAMLLIFKLTFIDISLS